MLTTAQTTGQQHTKGTTRGQRPRRPRPAEATDWMPPEYDYLPYGPPRHGPRRSAYLTECTRATGVSYGDGH